MRPFRTLAIWQRGRALALRVYRESKCFPATERFGLTAQLQRAALSVPSNVAEGSKRKSERDFAHFVNIAEGSLAEVESLIDFSVELGYLDGATGDAMLAECAEIAKMMCAFRARLH